MSTTGTVAANTQQLVVTQVSVVAARETLLSLWARNLPEATPERFDWLYSDDRSQAWLLEESEAGVIGSAGRTPRRLFIAGQVVEAGSAIDLNVDAPKRSLGPALALVREVAAASEREGLSLMYAIPIPAAEVVMKFARYRPIGAMSHWTKLLRSEYKLRAHLRFDWAARLAALFVDVGLRLFDPARHKSLPTYVTSDVRSAFDERFDRLWLRARDRFAVIGERTAEFLTWRFLKCPEVRYQIFTLVDTRSHELLGYVVWTEETEAVSVADLLAADGATTPLLLAEFSRMIRRTGAAAIRLGCFAPAEFHQALQAAGFSRRADGQHVLVKRLGDQNSVTANAESGDNWYLTMADHDVNS